MSTPLPAGMCAVRGDSIRAHLTPFVIGAHYLRALCGAKPTATWDAVTHAYTGPVRWAELRTGSYTGDLCPECLVATHGE